MKKILFCLFLAFSFMYAGAQAPLAFNYQGIARSSSGSPLTNRSIALEITLLEGALPGSAVYSEQHHVTTNTLGLFTVEVGHGSSQIGDFANIDWGGGDHYIQIKMDPDGGSAFQLMGQSRLLSVPYALYAGNVSGSGDLWQENADGIHFNSGNVGIGDSSPKHKLSILDNQPDDDGRILIDMVNLSNSNRSWTALRLAAGDSGSSTYLNHHAASYDYEGNKFTDFGQLFSSGSGIILRASREDGVIKFLAGGDPLSTAERMRITGNGFVGIGTEDPRQKLTIQGEDNDGTDIDYLMLNNVSKGNRSGVLMALSAGDELSQTTIGHHAETYDFDGTKFTDFGQVNSSGAGLILRASGNEGIIKFMTGHDEIGTSSERMRLTQEGHLGIGTEFPVAKVQVADGDIYIEDIQHGVIMKSPDGNCWRMTINNDGSIQTSAIACPN
jgi:hypothetical protein